MLSIENLLLRVDRLWTEQGLAPMTPASRDALKGFEDEYRIRLPDDFSTYLLTLGGLPLGEWDAHLIRVWSLGEIRLAKREPGQFADYFVFADYSISAPEYGIRVSKVASGDIAIVTLPQPILIADSFSEFLVRYLSDPMSLFKAKARREDDPFSS